MKVFLYEYRSQKAQKLFSKKKKKLMNYAVSEVSEKNVENVRKYGDFKVLISE